MANFVNDVVEVMYLKNDKGPYVKLKIRKEDGEIVDKTIYGEACKDFTTPGRYEVETEKRKTKTGHDFWAITAASLISATTGIQSGNGSSGAGARSISGGTEVYRNDAITAQVAIKAAAEITVAAIGKATQPISAEEATKYVSKIAEGLMVVSTVVHAKKDEGDAQEDLL